MKKLSKLVFPLTIVLAVIAGFAVSAKLNSLQVANAAKDAKLAELTKPEKVAEVKAAPTKPEKVAEAKATTPPVKPKKEVVELKPLEAGQVKLIDRLDTGITRVTMTIKEKQLEMQEKFDKQTAKLREELKKLSEKQQELVSQIAKERSLELGCFVPLARNNEKNCPSEKFWAITEEGAVKAVK